MKECMQVLLRVYISRMEYDTDAMAIAFRSHKDDLISIWHLKVLLVDVQAPPR